MKCEWVIPCQEVRRSEHGSVSIVNIWTNIKGASVPLTVPLSLAIRFSGHPGESAQFTVRATHRDNPAEGLAKHSGSVTIPTHTDMVDVVVQLPIRINHFGHHTIWLSVSNQDGESGNASWFYADKLTVN